MFTSMSLAKSPVANPYLSLSKLLYFTIATVRCISPKCAFGDELIEYLLARKRRDQERPPYEHYSLEHALSFQRRVKAVKQYFFTRGATTPLGICQDFWYRTEAQMRGALHMHCLVWLLRRVKNKDRQPIASIPRTAPKKKFEQTGSPE